MGETRCSTIATARRPSFQSVVVAVAAVVVSTSTAVAPRRCRQTSRGDAAERSLSYVVSATVPFSTVPVPVPVPVTVASLIAVAPALVPRTGELSSQGAVREVRRVDVHVVPRGFARIALTRSDVTAAQPLDEPVPSGGVSETTIGPATPRAP